MSELEQKCQEQSDKLVNVILENTELRAENEAMQADIKAVIEAGRELFTVLGDVSSLNTFTLMAKASKLIPVFTANPKQFEPLIHIFEKYKHL